MGKAYIRKIFLENLPRHISGNAKGRIHWAKSVGCKVKFQYGDIRGELEIVGYYEQSGRQYVYIKYENKEIFKILTCSLRRCELGKLLGTYTGDFRLEVGTNLKDDKRDLTITGTEIKRGKNNKIFKWYKYTCNRCGWTEGWVTEGNLLGLRAGCSCCYGQTAVLGINTIWDTDRWMCNLGVSEEDAKKHTRSSDKKIEVVCPDCGKKKDKKQNINDIYTRKSISCPCKDGGKYPEKFVFNMLDQLNIDFKIQLSKVNFKWCKNHRYDFYFEINNEQYIIETHGIQHYEESFVGCGGRTLEEEIENDRIKKELALQNGIKEKNYIVIDCRESKLKWIRDNILKSRLIELFDLSKINWLKCEEFALSNRVKEACELKKNNPDMTTKEIGEIMKLNSGAIVKYLKQGAELGWCNYNAKEESAKGCSKAGKMGGKPVEIFDRNGISLGMFESIAEMVRQSEELFGVQLIGTSISKVCLGKNPHHKHFTFRYI